MKNERKNQWHTVVVSFLLLLCIMGESMWKTQEIYAAQVDTPALTMVQSAFWTEEKEHRGEILVEISGWKGILNLPKEKDEETPVSEAAETQTEEIPVTEAAEMQTEVTPVTEAAGMQTEEIPVTEAAEVQEEAAHTTEKAEIQSEEEIEPQSETTEAEEEVLNSGQISSPELSLVYFLSPYFSVLNPESLPKDCTIEELVVPKKGSGQEIVTRITCPITVDESDTWKFRFPIGLRNQYEVLGQDQNYPTAEPLPLIEGQTGTGIYLVQKQGEELTVLSQTEPQFLTVPGMKSEFSFSLTAVQNQVKAGELAECKVKLLNTGETDLHQIELSASFSGESVKGTWEGAEGFSGGSAEGVAVLESLLAGAERQLTLFVSVPEEQENSLNLSVKASTPHPSEVGAWMEQTKELSVLVTPLKADYTVEKTADRTIAYPGETITYQICIRNTGEKTLHSVVSTERFLTAGMTAQFLPQNGVTLNSSKTQALIPKIERGQAVALEAAVVVPQNLQSQELMNQVTVVTAETGSRSIQSNASVQVYAPAPTAIPSVTQGLYQSGYQSKNGGSMSKGVSSYPKTGDPSQGEWYAGILGISLGMGAVAVLYRKIRQKKREEA